MKNYQRASFLASCCASLVLLLTPGAARGWGYAYGPAGSAEQGFRRVIPVDCPAEGPGYLAVGTLDQAGANPDVYAVYTTPAGNRVWEFSYDVEGFGYPDEGRAVVGLGDPAGAFMVLSNSSNGGVWRIGLTLLRCDGTVVWSRLYADALTRTGLRGYDLIRTNNGDLAIAGLWFNGLDDDAFLLRTTAAGVPLWNAAYDTAGDEAFHALAEVVGPNDPVISDLVAVGRYDKGGGDLQGLVARVDGGSGAIGPAPQCLAHHGPGDSDEVYHSVTVLADPLHAGELAMTGTTTGAGWLDDVWMTRGNPCALFAQSRIGNPAGGGPTFEQGYDLREITGPFIGPVGGALAVAGAFRPGAGLFSAATILDVASGTLMPLGGTGRTFGGLRDEEFRSLAEDPAFWPQTGFVLAGSTETAWTPGDPRDLYLVHHDPAAPILCDKGWSPGGIALDWPQYRIGALRHDPARSRLVTTPAIKLLTEQVVCPYP